jgi:hypothetical protein
VAVTRKELDELLAEEGYFSYVPCSSEEQKQFSEMKKENLTLPEDIYTPDDGIFVRLEKSELSEEEIRLLITLEQKRKIDSIFRVLLVCAAVFAVLCAAGFLR